MADLPPPHDPTRPHDACGVAFLADVRGRASRAIVADGLAALAAMAHRGAVGADPETGDGAGILLQIPHALLQAHANAAGGELPEPGRYALLQLFLKRGDAAARQAVHEALAAEGFSVRWERPVPVVSTAVGPVGRASAPEVLQVVAVPEAALQAQAEAVWDRRLFVARRRMERHGGVYVASCSRRSVVYKGLLLADRLDAYYPDLADERCVSAIAVVHQRFSTNTSPAWHRAQPHRWLAHNGEINTLAGNLARMTAREPLFASPNFDEGDLEVLRPLLSPGDSDSASLDRAAELLLHTGRSLPHALAMLVPEAWERHPGMTAQRRAFAAWNAAVMEPWDGPACVVFSDGRSVGACLDRNGLRPARWTSTDDGRVLLASEEGVLDIDPERITGRGRLGPGEMLLVDPDRGRLLLDEEIKGALANARPYRRWLAQSRVRLRALQPGPVAAVPPSRKAQARFGFTVEVIERSLDVAARTGKEPVVAMGDDTPIAVLDERPRSLFDYFHQRFAQVTNPPVDPLREQRVMSLRVSLGADGNLFAEGPELSRQLELDGPLLTDEGLVRLKGAEVPGVVVRTLETLFPAAEGDVTDAAFRVESAAALERELGALQDAAEAAAEEGATLLVLSDRPADGHRAPIPMLLAVAAVQQRLLLAGKRGRVGLIVDSGEVASSHHVAALLGFGAGAVLPRVALATVAARARAGRLGVDAAAATARLLRAWNRGLLKVLARMGICTLESYRGAGLFEVVGLAEEVVARYFPSAPRALGGADLGVIAASARWQHAQAELPSGGTHRWRRDGRLHAWNPTTIARLQKAVRAEDFVQFERYAEVVDDASQSGATLRSLLQLVPGEAVPLDEVEYEASIVRRFRTGAMSFGSLSAEAHEALAEAMNGLGGRSNSGEGGEAGHRDGSPRRSAIRQIASGRFGVTPRYLVHADELQIKMAQGAKPGEGGQLPGHKVVGQIAVTRHTTEGVTLISPPPHHDIYSIEDLHQLIFDLKQANPRAEVTVKLVASRGVGTIAAGVVKAGADGVLVAGRSGGTGASPLGSVHHAGLPWELGLAETRRALWAEGLRERARVEVDGGLRTGRDVLVAALLGAERFGFGTAALVAAGCVMMRACHKNTCPVGVATQDPELRALFAGQPAHVANLMIFVARQVREGLAELGFRSLQEAVGRTERLRAAVPARLWKAGGLQLGELLDGAQAGTATAQEPRALPGGELNERLLRLAERIRGGAQIELASRVRNTDRSVATALSTALAAGVPPRGALRVVLRGSAGQSLGAFLHRGVQLVVKGAANDGVGKGMHGGSISVAPPPGLRETVRGEVLVGNAALYGATGGRLFVRGRAGERFAVRNSGARAVVEGVGDHGCEYMTGGEVLVLGPTGMNFGAGMSGGRAWVVDRDGFLRRRLHPHDVRLLPLPEEDEALVRALLREHLGATGSPAARSALASWGAWRSLVAAVVPAGGGEVIRRPRRRLPLLDGPSGAPAVGESPAASPFTGQEVG